MEWDTADSFPGGWKAGTKIERIERREEPSNPLLSVCPILPYSHTVALVPRIDLLVPILEFGLTMINFGSGLQYGVRRTATK